MVAYLRTCVYLFYHFHYLMLVLIFHYLILFLSMMSDVWMLVLDKLVFHFLSRRLLEGAAALSLPCGGLILDFLLHIPPPVPSG